MKPIDIVQWALRAYHVIVPPRIDREIARALAIPQAKFPKSITLPKNYGRGMTERVVELLIARLTYQPGKKVLDVGHANIMNAHRRMLKKLPRPLDITGIDIAPVADEVRVLYTHSLVGSIAETTFPDESFDLIWCISALEHFGMDNALYTNRFTIDKNMDAKALNEMVRILRRNGMLYISVPYGKFEDHGWLRNYDAEHWQTLLSLVRPTCLIDEMYFRYTDDRGWGTAEPEELSKTGYFDHQNSGASGLAVALIRKVK